MHRKPKGTLAPRGETDPNGRYRAERLLPGSPERWTIVRHVREALDDRFAERELRIADLAAVAGVDPSHLARSFRAHYGTTAGAYLREIRVQRAAKHGSPLSRG